MRFSFWRVPASTTLVTLLVVTGAAQAAGYLDPVVDSSAQPGRNGELELIRFGNANLPGQRRPRSPR